MFYFYFLALSQSSFVKIKPSLYKEGELIPIFADSIRSPLGLLPLDYFFSDLHQKPINKFDISTNLDPLLGKKTQKTSLSLKMLKNEKCVSFSKAEIKQNKYPDYYYVIYNHYEVTLLIDKLPFITNLGKNKTKIGYPIGFVGVLNAQNYTSANEVHLVKHLEFTIFVTKNQNETFSISNAYVTPYIIDPCSRKDPLPLHMVNESVLTYSVKWVTTKTQEKERFFNVLQNMKEFISYNENIHSLFIVFVCIFVIGYISLFIIVKNDVGTFSTGFQEDDTEAAGWVVCAGDAFRFPNQISVYSTFISSGLRFGLASFIQYILHTFIPLIDQTNTDLFWLTFLIVDLISSFVAGIGSGWFMKETNVVDFGTKRIIDSFVPSVIITLLLLFMELIYFSEESTAFISFSSFLFVAIIVSILSFAFHQGGSMIGFSFHKAEEPTRKTLIPRKIPEHSFPIQKLIMAIGGLIIAAFIIPFLPSVKTVLFCNYGLHKMMPNLAEIATVVILSSSFVTVTCVFIILRMEDYQWWIYSAGLPFFSGAFILLYELIFLVRKLWNVYFGTKVIFVTFCLLESLMISVISAAFGFLSTMYFVFFIYRTFGNK